MSINPGMIRTETPEIPQIDKSFTMLRSLPMKGNSKNTGKWILKCHSKQNLPKRPAVVWLYVKFFVADVNRCVAL